MSKRDSSGSAEEFLAREGPRLLQRLAHAARMSCHSRYLDSRYLDAQYLDHVAREVCGLTTTRVGAPEGLETFCYALQVYVEEAVAVTGPHADVYILFRRDRLREAARLLRLNAALPVGFGPAAANVGPTGGLSLPSVRSNESRPDAKLHCPDRHSHPVPRETGEIDAFDPRRISPAAGRPALSDRCRPVH
ncbi:MAG: hypothetical protein AAF458_00475 [Pseudomonadota bacterium]